MKRSKKIIMDGAGGSRYEPPRTFAGTSFVSSAIFFGSAAAL